MFVPFQSVIRAGEQYYYIPYYDGSIAASRFGEEWRITRRIWNPPISGEVRLSFYVDSRWRDTLTSDQIKETKKYNTYAQYVKARIKDVEPYWSRMCISAVITIIESDNMLTTDELHHWIDDKGVHQRQWTRFGELPEALKPKPKKTKWQKIKQWFMDLYVSFLENI